DRGKLRADDGLTYGESLLRQKYRFVEGGVFLACLLQERKQVVAQPLRHRHSGDGLRALNSSHRIGRLLMDVRHALGMRLLIDRLRCQESVLLLQLGCTPALNVLRFKLKPYEL